MRFIIALSLIIFILSDCSGQKLEARGNIEYNRHIILSGQIDSLYKITMYLEYRGTCGFEDSALQWRNRKLSGWYAYDNVGTKIPLIGYEVVNDNYDVNNSEYDYYNIELFVPKNYTTDTISTVSCFPENYAERFYSLNSSGFQNLNWSKGNKNLPVQLRVTKGRDLKTKTLISLRYAGLDIGSIDVTQSSGLGYIEYIKVHDVKDVNDKMHITFEVAERSTPGGSGGGQCGMGMDRYMGYIRLNKNWRLERSDYRLNHSCCCPDKVEAYRYVEGKPELGLVPLR